MTATATTCPCCGYPCQSSPCELCAGTARTLNGRAALPPVRRDRWFDAIRGLREVARAGTTLLHGREFIGLLRVPILMNAIAFLLLVLGGWLLLAPLFDAAFGGSWWLLDGWRQSCRDHGPSAWLATTWLLLGPPLLDLCAGAAQEPLRAATERRMLGPTRGSSTRHGVLRLRERARVLAWLLLAWPVALAVVLIPWLGWPLVGLAGAAVAAIVWFEAPMAPRGYPLRERLALINQNRYRALGVGLGLQLAAAVPFVNLLALAPIATIAATASYLQFDKRRPSA